MKQLYLHCRDEPAQKKRKAAKRKKHFSDYVVGVSLAAVLAYTVAAFTLQFICNIEISPTLTACFYSFFGVELINLALIKRGKIKATDILPNAAADITTTEADRTKTEGGNYGRGI